MIGEYISGLSEKARANNPAVPGDWKDENGLLHCGKCGDAKEIILEGRRLCCACNCSREGEQEKKKEKERERLNRKRTVCFASPKLEGYRIEEADGGRATEIVKRYINNWKTAKENNYGLLLWGNVGTGKSYLAACIANAVIDMGESAKMRAAGDIVMEAQDAENRAEYIDELKRVGLLVIDDLGTERNTNFGAEIIFSVIDKRYQEERPLIVTTNIPLQNMKSEIDAGKNRLYDRILEICVPVKLDGESRRKTKAAERMAAARKILGA